MLYFLNFSATLYSLSDVSSAAKLSSVPLRYHCTGGSRYRDRTAKQEPSCADAFGSLPLATLSTAEIHRPALESDSCPLLRFPSMFSIKNDDDDDAFDEVGAWFRDRFSSMFSQKKLRCVCASRERFLPRLCVAAARIPNTHFKRRSLRALA